MNRFFIKIVRYSINMSRQELEIPGARLQGSGGFFLFLTKIIQDILDEESKFSNMRKNNNNVHPGNKREPRDEPIASQSLRIGISATHKAVQEITHPRSDQLGQTIHSERPPNTRAQGVGGRDSVQPACGAQCF